MALLRNTIMYASFSRLTEVADNVLSAASLTVANIHGYGCSFPETPNEATISIPTYALPPELVKCFVALTQLAKLLFSSRALKCYNRSNSHLYLLFHPIGLLW